MDWGNYDRSRFRPDDLDGVLLDRIQFDAWCGLMHWMMGRNEYHRQFAEATGRKPVCPDEEITGSEDEQQGFLDHYTGDFVRWATREHWGENEITPSIREVMGNFPRAQ